MAGHDEVIAPPPKGQGLFGRAERQTVAGPAPVPREGHSPKVLVRQGFWLGVGIWLAFAAISAVVWLVAVILFAAAIGGLTRSGSRSLRHDSH